MKKQINAKPRTTLVSPVLKEKLESGVPLQSHLLAVSRAGHDKDIVYVVLEEEKEYVWLADGRRRTLQQPKKKKKMHVQLIRHLSEEVQQQLRSIELDAHLRKAIAMYEKKEKAADETCSNS